MTSTSPPSLLDTCRDRVLDGTYDLSRLEALPATVLVQLLQTCVADKLAAQAHHAASASQLAAVRDRRYFVEPSRNQDRVGPEMYERVARVVAKWEPMPNAEDGHHRRRTFSGKRKELVYFRSKRCFELHPCDRDYAVFGRRDGDHCKVYQIVSSALLLYRLCCLFATPVEVAGPAGYKCVWLAQLKHRATGEAVGFGERKGAAGVDADCYDGQGEFHADLVELMNLLCDDQCPQPCDGCVAGAVA